MSEIWEARGHQRRPVFAGLHDRDLLLLSVVLDPEERDRDAELIVKSRAVGKDRIVLDPAEQMANNWVFFGCAGLQRGSPRGLRRCWCL